MNKPLVTVITPVYNCEKYIERTINSVLDNGYENIEYIVIDDASKDKTLDILAGFDYSIGRESSRFDVWSSKVNRGEQHQVNRGLKYINIIGGKYFMIVNADDPLLPNAIEALVNYMESHPDVLCAYPDWFVIDEEGNTRHHVRSKEYDFTYMVKHHTCLPSVGSMFRSDVIEKTGYRDTSYHWLGDFDFWLKVGLAGKMAHVPLTLATWRHRDGQASGDKSDKRAQEHVRIIKSLYSMPNIPAEILKVKREAICWSYVVATAVTDSKIKIVYYIIKGFLSYPGIALSFEFWDSLIRRAYYILRR